MQGLCGNYGAAGAGVEFDHLQIPRASRPTGVAVGIPAAPAALTLGVNGAFYLHFLELFFVYHCYTANVHWGFTGYLWVFPAISMKRAVRITEKPYTPQRERLCIVGNPVVFSYHRVYPAICRYYRVSAQHTQPFHLRSTGFLCDSYSPLP